MKTPEVFKHTDSQGNITSGLTMDEPLVLAREVVLSFLRYIYKNIQEPELIYSEDVDLTKIRIEDANNLDLAKLNVWPAISVARSTLNTANIVIGDRGPSIGDPYPLLSSDIKMGVDLLTGAIIVNSYSKNSYEAEKIGFINFITMKVFQSELRKTIFHDFSPMGISPAMLSGSQSDTYMVSVNVNFAIEIEWLTHKILDTLFGGCIRLDLTSTVPGGVGAHTNECPPPEGAT